MTGYGEDCRLFSVSGSDPWATVRHHSYQDGRPAGGPKPPAEAGISRTNVVCSGNQRETVSVRAEEWFAARSFSYREFGDIAELIRLKLERRIELTLILPTRNVVETIGPILETVTGESSKDVCFTGGTRRGGNDPVGRL